MAKKTSKKTKKEAKNGHGPLSFFNDAPGAYPEVTRRPLYGLAFLLPLVLVYELGIMFTDSLSDYKVRITAFSWLIDFALHIGMKPSLAKAFPGFVVVIVLLCWQLSSNHDWKIKPRWLGGMALESIIWAMPLFLIGALLETILRNMFDSSWLLAAVEGKTAIQMAISDIVTSIGAGIYEELIFRLIVMGILIMLFEDVLKRPALLSIILAAVLSSVLFAVYHYIGVRTDADGGWSFYQTNPIRISGFLFRVTAGLYFAYIFKIRGFGIAAGSHCVYDIIFFSIYE
ncbi:MAG: CPBP family intramembrane metalloprotease [Phycisphaerae bacterium]|nr:CPBP family intramembrane metalloprotease [Phycisphaerae bacterium]